MNRFDCRAFLAFLAIAGAALSPLPAGAQIKVAEVDAAYVAQVDRIAAGMRPSEADLLALRPGAPPADVMDRLRASDWYEVCSYSTADRRYSSRFTGPREAGTSRQLVLFRLGADGVLEDLQLMDAPRRPPTLYTTTFDRARATRLDGFATIRDRSYRVTETGGVQEYHPFVALRDGLLVVDITRNGRPGEKPVKYRVAWVAVPRPPVTAHEAP
jgi:hypothetical protein